MRRLGKAALAVVLAVALYLGAGTLGGLIPGAVADIPDGQGPDVTILLLPGPIHTDILVPMTPQVRETFAFAEADGVPVAAPGADWLIVGWGARQFYTRTRTWGDMRPGPVLRAITGDTSTLRLGALGPLTTDEGLTALTLSAGQFDALLAAIRAETGPVLPVPGFGTADRFYASDGHFSILRTCNAWVGEVLRASGIPTGIWTPFTWTLP